MSIRPSILCIAVSILCVAVTLTHSHKALAQQGEPQPVVGCIGEPFSGVRTVQGANNFADGNRIDRGTTVRLYRDGQGRTRVEREVPAVVLANNPRLEPVDITINDPVSGERIELRPKSKTAFVFRGGALPARPPSHTPPDISATFARHLYAANDPGWSKPVSLGEKSFDGLRATGQRRQYSIPVGAIGNEKPIQLTVEQWFIPELSLVVARSSKASLGGELGNQVENIVRGEPDPALFLIPSDYSRIEAGHPQAAAH